MHDCEYKVQSHECISNTTVPIVYMQPFYIVSCSAACNLVQEKDFIYALLKGIIVLAIVKHRCTHSSSSYRLEAIIHAGLLGRYKAFSYIASTAMQQGHVSLLYVQWCCLGSLLYH